MNSHPKSVGKFFLKVQGLILVVGITSTLFFTGCTRVRKDRNPEVSLKSDQEQLEDLRAQIPEEKRHENDELAVIMAMVVDTEFKERPENIRIRFDRLMHQRREDFRKDNERSRSDYSEKERNKREKFLSDQKADREKFKKKKRTPKVAQKYYQEQDVKRRDYFADERDNRKRFESEYRQKTSDFNFRITDWKRKFEEEFRAYQKRHKEHEARPKEMTPGTP